MESPGPDAGTLERAVRGDAAAFRTLVECWQGIVLGFCRRACGDGAAAEDLAQEVFLRVYQVLHRYDRARPFAPWMRRVMVRSVLNGLRARRRLPATTLDGGEEGAGTLPDPRPAEPASLASRAEEAERVRREVALLPPDQRVVVLLRYQEALPVEDIAATLEIPVNTVKTRLFRARAALRRSLGERAGVNP